MAIINARRCLQALSYSSRGRGKGRKKRGGEARSGASFSTAHSLAWFFSGSAKLVKGPYTLVRARLTGPIGLLGSYGDSEEEKRKQRYKK